MRNGRELITATVDDSKTAVIERMKENGVSQLPVVDHDQHYVGMITEVSLLKHLLTPDHHEKSETIADVIEKDAAVPIHKDTTLDALPEIFAASKIAVVLEDQAPIGIVTKIDLIDYLAGRMS